MNIAIIDADLIGRKKHRFPNLVSMKLSKYYQDKGENVILKRDYDNLNKFDRVFISKVFTDTFINEKVLTLPNVEYGGTGFYFDQAPNLSNEIEHYMPDYHLYDEFVKEQIENGVPKISLKEYTDYSIGFITRGCFRKCPFCVNQKYDHVFLHSPLEEFYDSSRKKICLLDDNFLGYKNWKYELERLIDTGKPFKFKQGLDERILTDEKCKLLFSAKYDGDITFAFDNIKDKPIIEKKLEMIRKYTDKQLIFYVLCGFDENGKYDEEFWIRDIYDTLERIKILSKYKCIPYIMRFNKYLESPYRGMYVDLARWCNQKSLFKKKSLTEFVNMESNHDAARRYLKEFIEKHGDNEYFHMKFMDLSNI